MPGITGWGHFGFDLDGAGVFWEREPLGFLLCSLAVFQSENLMMTKARVQGHLIWFPEPRGPSCLDSGSFGEVWDLAGRLHNPQKSLRVPSLD